MKEEIKRSAAPDPDEIKRARIESGLTQAAAAKIVYTVPRVWQQWESGERRMHPAFWELFKDRKPITLEKFEWPKPQ